MLMRLSDWLDAAPRWKVVSVAIFSWYALYFLPAVIPTFPESQWPLLSFEKKIPFMEWTGLVYVSIFIQIILAFLIMNKEILGKAVLGCILIETVHSFFFFIAPSNYPRIGINPLGGWAWWYDLLWLIDKPNNCFPSVHVGIAFMAGFAMLRQNRPLGTIFIIWTILICISTLTTKQHYLLDILAGAAIALLSYHFVFHFMSHGGDRENGKTVATG